MKMKFITATVLTALFFSAYADYVSDFQSAQNLFDSHKWNDAAEAFKVLSDQAKGESKDTCLSFAARAFANAKKYDEANGIVERMSDAKWKAFTDMSILSISGKSKELAEKYKEERIEDWPEEISYLGYIMRGLANSPTAAAVPDLEKAIAGTGSDFRNKGRVFNALSGCYMNAQDYEKAAEASGKVIAIRQVKGTHFWFEAIYRKADAEILLKNLDDAQKTLDTLKDYKFDKTLMLFKFLWLEKEGDLELAKGAYEKAAEYYNQALTIEVYPFYINKLKGKISKLPTAKNIN